MVLMIELFLDEMFAIIQDIFYENLYNNIWNSGITSPLFQTFF